MDDLKNMLDESRIFYREQEKKIVSLLAGLPKGSIRKKKIKNTFYYYLRYRKGDRVVDDYLGKEIPDNLTKQLEERKKLEKELKGIRNAMELVQEKPSANTLLIEPLEDILRTMTEMGLWEEGIEIIGSWCFLFYQRYLNLESYPLKTEDLDFLIPIPYKGKDFDLTTYLKNLGFQQEFRMDGSIFFTGHTMKIEFLTPERGRGSNKPVRVNALTVTPQSLRFMDMLLDKPMIIGIGKGIKVKLPSPTAFFFHKLLLVPRRKEKGKQVKDLRQAVIVGGYILETPEQRKLLVQQWNAMMRSWKKTIKKTLAQAREIMPSERTRIEAIEHLLP